MAFRILPGRRVHSEPNVVPHYSTRAMAEIEMGLPRDPESYDIGLPDAPTDLAKSLASFRRTEKVA